MLSIFQVLEGHRVGKGLAVFLRWRTVAWGKGSKTYPGKEVKEKVRHLGKI